MKRKAKFEVGQVVMFKGNFGDAYKVAEFRRSGARCEYRFYFKETWWDEGSLRPLTKREKG